MTDLDFSSGTLNLGGNYSIRFAPVAGILILPLPNAAGITQPATFRSGFRWFSLYGSQDTKPLEEDEQESDNGPIWNVKVMSFLPGDSADLRKQLVLMARHRFVLEVDDNQGLVRRVGTLSENLTLSYSFKTGGAMGDRKGALLTFSGQLSSPAPIV